jgi:hypothetical protein
VETSGAVQGQSLTWQRRRGGGRVRVYVCCCPLGLLLVPPLLLARLARWALARRRADRRYPSTLTGGAGTTAA